MFEGKIAKFVGGGMFPEEDLKKLVHNHALIGAIILAIPGFGIDWLAYCVVLWHMYHKLCQRVNQTLGCGTIVLGVGVNMVVAIVVDLLLTLIPLLSGFLAYLQFYLSGKAFIETLKKGRYENKEPQVIKEYLGGQEKVKVENASEAITANIENNTYRNFHSEIKRDNSNYLPFIKKGLVVLCVLSVVLLAFGIYSCYTSYLQNDTSYETENVLSEEIFMKQDYIIADVKGHVKSVNSKESRYTFQRNGLLIDYSPSWEDLYEKETGKELEKRIERDKDGYIKRIFYSTFSSDDFDYDKINKRLSKFENSNDGGSTTITFTYDENGNVIRENVVDWITDLDGENEETKTHTIYITVLETDSKGNWTKRKYNDKIQTRTIEYY